MADPNELYELAVYSPAATGNRWRIVMQTNYDGICNVAHTEHADDEVAAKAAVRRLQGQYEVLQLMLARKPAEQGPRGPVQSLSFVSVDQPWTEPEVAHG